MAYRLAQSLVALRDAVNAAAPRRGRASDGWIGDAAHASRKSDHNPWVKDGSMGVVTALDITHDPAHGVDGHMLAKALILDPRVKYVIWDKKIWSDAKRGWRKYTGINPHTKHVHASVLNKKALYDDVTPWKVLKDVPPEVIGEVPPPVLGEVPPPEIEVQPVRATLKLKDQGGDVFELQRLLGGGLKIDGDFGPKTERAVKAFQKARKLKQDGIVGPYTWDALLAKKATVTPQWAVEKLVGMGWSKRDAAVWVAHLMWESGGHGKDQINWEAKGDRGNSKGGGQWNKAAGRWAALDQFAASHGTDWTDPETQLGFLNHELGGSERSVANAVRNAPDFETAMRAAVNYWRPGVPHMDKRLEVGERLRQTVGI